MTHPHTEQCGFDRNSSHTEKRYVCMCGWSEPRGWPERFWKLLDEAAAALSGVRVPKKLLIEHIVDLESCATICVTHGMNDTAREFRKAAAEFRECLAAAKGGGRDDRGRDG